MDRRTHLFPYGYDIYGQRMHRPRALCRGRGHTGSCSTVIRRTTVADETPADDVSADAADEGDTLRYRTFPPMFNRRFFWGALTIMLIWIAVLFIGVFADETAFRYSSPTDTVEIPVSLGIAFLAFFATWVVALVSFRKE
jgi:hypothetical protein